MGDIFNLTPGHFGERQTDIGGTTANYGGWKGTTFTQHIGDSSFSSNGGITTRIGGTSYINGEQVYRQGDVYHYHGKTYTKVGNSLFSSAGGQWNSIDGMNDRDIEGIIRNDN